MSQLAPEGRADHLGDRYGHRRRRGIDRWIAIVTGGVLGAVVLTLVVFGVMYMGGAKVEYQDIGYTINEDRTVDVRFEVTAEPGTDVLCAIEALSQSFAIVGWDVVEVPASERRKQFSETTLVTTSEPTTGYVRSCWVPAEGAA